MIPKAGKSAEEVTSYRPISLLPTMSNVIEKLIYKCLFRVINRIGIIPEHQFGFQERHAIVEQVSRVADTIRKALENKEYCPALFLDISQAFDRIWMPGLLSKISSYVPKHLILLIEFYLYQRNFYVAYGELNLLFSLLMTASRRAAFLVHFCIYCSQQTYLSNLDPQSPPTPMIRLS